MDAAIRILTAFQAQGVGTTLKDNISITPTLEWDKRQRVRLSEQGMELSGCGVTLFFLTLLGLSTTIGAFGRGDNLLRFVR